MDTKRKFFCLFLGLSLSVSAFYPCELSLNTTNTWYNLGKYKNPTEKNALVKFITFRSPRVLKLQALTLKWTGKPIKKLSASLYRKKYEKDVLAPIEENVVSDGTWNNKKQELAFNLDEKLIAFNKYYLVLNYPSNIEKNIKRGKFIPIKQRPYKVVAMR
ncbi:hypothetical protein KAW80_01605 [Candidatus Babeliales bacterium]|nr:hypothetical protein [Candidatus Babeliales bacterium]